MNYLIMLQMTMTHVKSASEAVELENQQAGNPGFLVAKWVKENKNWKK